MTLKELCLAVGVNEEIPTELDLIYGRIQNVKELFGLEYLDSLQNKYTLFEDENYLALKKGLQELSDRKALLKWGILAIEYIKLCKTSQDMEKMPMPEPDGTAAGDMLMLLVTIPFIEIAIKRYEARGFSRSEAVKEMKTFNGCVNILKARLGRAVYNRNYFLWNSRYIFATIFRCETLTFEVTKFRHDVILLKNKTKGVYETIMTDGAFHSSGHCLETKGLTDDAASFGPYFIETDTEIAGYTARDGYAICNIKRFNKSEWEIKLRKGDAAVSIHIPRGSDISPLIVKETIRKGMSIVRSYYGDDIRYCFCGSWLLSPNICECLDADSKILAFQNIFHRYPVASNGRELMTFLFNSTTNDYRELCENTSLQRKVKKLYIEGSLIYTGAGIITEESYYADLRE